MRKVQPGIGGLMVFDEESKKMVLFRDYEDKKNKIKSKIVNSQAPLLEDPYTIEELKEKNYVKKIYTKPKILFEKDGVVATKIYSKEEIEMEEKNKQEEVWMRALRELEEIPNDDLNPLEIKIFHVLLKKYLSPLTRHIYFSAEEITNFINQQRGENLKPLKSLSIRASATKIVSLTGYVKRIKERRKTKEEFVFKIDPKAFAETISKRSFWEIVGDIKGMMQAQKIKDKLNSLKKKAQETTEIETLKEMSEEIEKNKPLLDKEERTIETAVKGVSSEPKKIVVQSKDDKEIVLEINPDLLKGFSNVNFVFKGKVIVHIHMAQESL